MSSDPVTGTARAQVPARLLDLSLGGALLDLSTSLDVGAIHDFALQLDGEVLWVQGEVRRCRKLHDDRFEQDPVTGRLLGGNGRRQRQDKSGKAAAGAPPRKNE